MFSRPSLPSTAPSPSACGSTFDRRRFLATSSAAGILAASSRTMVFGAPSPKSAAESVIGELYQNLSDDQKKVVAFGWNDPLRLKVNANWHVTKPRIGDGFFNAKQKSMIEAIVKNLTSESGHERLKHQTEDDDGGLEAYSVAWFGQPGDAHFEWMLTGRHLTLRADGNTVDKIAFGGPVVYGHGDESSPKDNLFYYQTEKVQRLFESLSAEDRKAALLASDPPGEAKVAIQGPSGKFLGLSVGTMQSEQKKLFKDAVTTILNMYRDEDSSEAAELIESNGGIESMRIAYFSKNDLLKDGVWDIWRIEGPATVIHFRGAPHVHAYIHVAAPRAS